MESRRRADEEQTRNEMGEEGERRKGSAEETVPLFPFPLLSLNNYRHA
jgi:hypothetical protein